MGYDSDLDEVRALTLTTLADVDGVLSQPRSQAYFTEHGASSVVLDVQYWTGSHQAEVRRVQDRVVGALYDAYNSADIELPFDVLTLDAAERFERAVQGRPATTEDDDLPRVESAGH